MSVKGLIAWIIYLPVTMLSLAWVTEFFAAAVGMVWLVAYVLAINGLAFAIYGWDKGVSIVLGWLKFLGFLPLRVPEALLVWGLAFPGGIVGAVMAMLIFNHKTGPSPDAALFRMSLLRASAFLAAILLSVIVIVTATSIDLIGFLEALIETCVNLVSKFLELIG